MSQLNLNWNLGVGVAPAVASTLTLIQGADQGACTLVIAPLDQAGGGLPFPSDRVTLPAAVAAPLIALAYQTLLAQSSEFYAVGGNQDYSKATLVP